MHDSRPLHHVLLTDREKELHYFREILAASTIKAKITLPEEAGLEYISLPNEASTADETAINRIKAVRDQYVEQPTDPLFFFLATATSLVIPALSTESEEPGMKLEQWQREGISDQEIRMRILNLMRGKLLGAENKGIFNTVVASWQPYGPISVAYGSLEGHITAPLVEPFPDQPLANMFLVPHWNMLLAELMNISLTGRVLRDWLTHYEIAVRNVFLGTRPLSNL